MVGLLVERGARRRGGRFGGDGSRGIGGYHDGLGYRPVVLVVLLAGIAWAGGRASL